jgi:hypothetical protein
MVGPIAKRIIPLATIQKNATNLSNVDVMIHVPKTAPAKIRAAVMNP